MEKFWKLMAESVIVQSMLALIFSVAVLVLVIMGKEVPSEIWGLLGIIIGWYFGTKSQQTITTYLKSKEK